MFSFKNKLDSNLKYYLANNAYRSYRVLIKYKNFQDSLEKKINSNRGTIYFSINSIKLICAEINSKCIYSLIEYPEIEKIFFDEYLSLCGMSVSTANKVHFAKSHNLSGAGIGIGLVDSGVYPHTDLTSPNNRIELFVDLINNLKYPYDDNGHGTAISGLLCSSGISSNNMYKGICSHSSLYCYKAFDSLGKGFASSILFAIESLINISEEHNIKILCLPFELLSHNVFIISCFENIFNYAISKNLIPIVPSGSSLNNKYSIMGISTLQNCITVGGVNTTTSSVKSYTYSSAGPYSSLTKPNLSAACENIVSLNCDTNYISEKNDMKLYPRKLEAAHKTFSGTSLAVAYITGICSLICERTPNINLNDMLSLLKVGCDTIENIPKYIQGDGIINLSKLKL